MFAADVIGQVPFWCDGVHINSGINPCLAE